MSVTIAKPAPITIGPLEIDPYLRTVRVDGRRVDLTRREYTLLLTLAQEPERAFTREGYSAAPRAGSSSTAPGGAPRIKLGRSFVVNVWGVGYRLVEWGDAS